MKRYRIAAQASVDLAEIWAFIAADSISAADRFLDDVAARCESAARLPGIGRRREELGPGYRSVPVGSYLIFYQPTAEGIEVIRILSGFRDLSSAFGDD